MSVMRPILIAALFASVCVLAPSAGALAETQCDTAEIRKAFDLYIAAFNAGDADSLAERWAEDAEYKAPTGAAYKGRAKIREAFDAFFRANRGARLSVTVTDTLCDSSNQARTRGTAAFSREGGPPTESQFTAVLVKKGDAWMMASVGEAESGAGGYPHLKDLEWLIGEWGGGDDNTRAETSFEWIANKNFISVSFKIFENGEPESEGMEIIGWDPVKKTIRSWFFDSSGRFGDGIWSKEGGRWTVRTSATLGDGQKASAINVFSPVDVDSFKWSSTGREVAGEPLPNTSEHTVTRKNPAK